MTFVQWLAIGFVVAMSLRLLFGQNADAVLQEMISENPDVPWPPIWVFQVGGILMVTMLWPVFLLIHLRGFFRGLLK